jgi:hypothetical protein
VSHIKCWILSNVSANTADWWSRRADCYPGILPLDSCPLFRSNNQHHQIQLTTYCPPYIRLPKSAQPLHTYSPWIWQLQCLLKHWITHNIRCGSIPKAELIRTNYVYFQASFKCKKWCVMTKLCLSICFYSCSCCNLTPTLHEAQITLTNSLS